MAQQIQLAKCARRALGDKSGRLHLTWQRPDPGSVAIDHALSSFDEDGPCVLLNISPDIVSKGVGAAPAVPGLAPAPIIAWAGLPWALPNAGCSFDHLVGTGEQRRWLTDPNRREFKTVAVKAGVLLAAVGAVPVDIALEGVDGRRLDLS